MERAMLRGIVSVACLAFAGPQCCSIGQKAGEEGGGGLRVEEIWSVGESVLDEGVSLPVRAMWSATPGEVKLLRPNGEFERDIQLPPPGVGGFLSSLSDDGSIAILRSGVTIRSGWPLLTRVLDLRENRVLFEGESSTRESFSLSPGGEMVLHNHVGRSSSLLRRDLSVLRSTNSLVVKWDFSRQYLATLEVDLLGASGPIRASLYLRVYDFEGNLVLEEYLDEASAGTDLADIDIEDDGTLAGLYRKSGVLRWMPPGTYSTCYFVLVVGHLDGADAERYRFIVPGDTRYVQLALSPNGRYLALSLREFGSISLYELDAIRENPEVLDHPLRMSSLPETLPGRPDVRVQVSSGVFEVSSRGVVVRKVVCFEGDKSFVRVLLSDLGGTWSAVPTPDLDLGQRTFCRFFGPEDYLLVGSECLLKCFRVWRR